MATQITKSKKGIFKGSKAKIALKSLLWGKKVYGWALKKFRKKSLEERKKAASKKKIKGPTKRAIAVAKSAAEKKVVPKVKELAKDTPKKAEVKSTLIASFTKSGKLDSIGSFRTAMTTAANEKKRPFLDRQKAKMAKAGLKTITTTTKRTVPKLGMR